MAITQAPTAAEEVTNSRSTQRRSNTTRSRDLKAQTSNLQWKALQEPLSKSDSVDGLICEKKDETATDTHPEELPGISSLPDDIVLSIFSLLPVDSQPQLQCVCKQWDKLVPCLEVNNSDRWRRLHIDTPQLLLGLADFLEPGEKVRGKTKGISPQVCFLIDVIDSYCLKLAARWGMSDIHQWSREKILEKAKEK